MKTQLPLHSNILKCANIVKIPLASVKIEKITSIDQFKAMNVDLKSLQPAVLKGS
jgi:hypothetical protein